MLTWQRQIYSGTPEIRMPNIIYTYTLCPEGRVSFIIDVCKHYLFVGK